MRLTVGLSLRVLAATLLLVGFGLPRAWSAAKKPPTQVTKAKIKISFKEPAGYTKKRRSLQSLYKQASPGVVRIICTTDDGPNHMGSGFFVSKTGLLVTNWHVIRDRNLLGISIETSDGLQLKVNVLAIDREADLAILQGTSPITAQHVFSGRPAEDVKAGEAATIIGQSSNLRLSFSTGLVSGLRSAAEVREALENKFSLGHKYKYLQTDACVRHDNSGGPLLDEKGQVLGVVSVGIVGSRISFAIEWQAVADLLKKADGAQSISLTSIRKQSAGEQEKPIYFEAPTQAKDVGLAANLADRNMYCGKCHGTGAIKKDVKIKKMVLRRVLVTGAGHAPYYITKKEVITVTKKVPTACSLCQGSGINPQDDKLYKRLCALVRAMSRMDETDGQVSLAWRKGTETLEKFAFDNIRYADLLTEHARGTLGAPQKHLGEPIVLIGKLQAVELGRDVSYLLIVIYGTNRPAYVWCPGSVTALEGQWCQVAGVIGGLVENAPLVMAVNVSGLQVNPKLKPFEEPPRRRR